jgi:hypothetical protein
MVRCAVAPMGDHPANRAAPPARAIAAGGRGSRALASSKHSTATSPVKKRGCYFGQASTYVRRGQGPGARGGYFMRASPSPRVGAVTLAPHHAGRRQVSPASSAWTTAFFNRVANSGEHKARPRTTQTRPDRSPPAYISPLVVYII